MLEGELIKKPGTVAIKRPAPTRVSRIGNEKANTVAAGIQAATRRDSVTARHAEYRVEARPRVVHQIGKHDSAPAMQPILDSGHDHGGVVVENLGIQMLLGNGLKCPRDDQFAFRSSRSRYSVVVFPGRR